MKDCEFTKEHTMSVSTIDPEHLAFLDELRDSGQINMFGARPHLQEAFGLSKKESSEILVTWMSEFSTDRAS